ncbi:hypothetical protein SISNIDRAFT_451352 [Sistotremastrum niveocremeum HHB9708]|uniref:Uncharacterized protein n=1 Tax=Sistotremastrum niveocremeum HHB9708 TaxID=1314777 RepID=A0A164X8M5_9AGAM|nr:hypothetical protein SISNIDRAFT_451352 [Sistotremastrum niveocremeum HHB9708]
MGAIEVPRRMPVGKELEIQKMQELEPGENNGNKQMPGWMRPKHGPLMRPSGLSLASSSFLSFLDAQSGLRKKGDGDLRRSKAIVIRENKQRRANSSENLEVKLIILSRTALNFARALRISFLTSPELAAFPFRREMDVRLVNASSSRITASCYTLQRTSDKFDADLRHPHFPRINPRNKLNCVENCLLS